MNTTNENQTKTITNSLKEMLKISDSGIKVLVESVPEQNQNNVSEAGDIMKQAVKQEMRQESNKVEITSSKSKENRLLSNRINLENVEDGICVDLNGFENRIVANKSTENENESSTSNKIFFKTITKFEWDYQYYLGNLISVTSKLMAYCVKGRQGNSIRIINRQSTSNRSLLKGFTGVITDVAFAHPHSNILAAVDNNGNLIFWHLSESDGKIQHEVKLHSERNNEFQSNPTSHRIVWLPNWNHLQGDSSLDFSKSGDNNDSVNDAGIMALFFESTVEIWYTSLAFSIAEQCESVKVERSKLNEAIVTIREPAGDITDCELSPFGNVIAIANSQGTIKFWQFDEFEEISCLHELLPHDGRPISAIRFCDELNQSEPRIFWRFLLTGCDRNIELKMWCAVKWECLQILHFQASSPDYPIPEMNLAFLRSANFIILSDICRKVLYVVQIETNLKEETAKFSSLAHYTLAGPVLNVAFIGIEDYKLESSRVDSDLNESKIIDYFSDPESAKAEVSSNLTGRFDGVMVKLLAIQRKSLQSLDIRFLYDENKQEDCDPIISSQNGIQSDVQDEDEAAAISNVVKNQTYNAATTSNSFLGAGDGVYASTALPTELGVPDKKHEESIDVKSNTSLRSNASIENKSLTQNNVTQPTTSPLLLTPDAFTDATGNFKKSDENPVNSTTSMVDPEYQSRNGAEYNNIGVKQVEDPFSKLLLASDDKKGFNTPPSSPTIPVSKPSSTVETPLAVAELLQSLRFSGVASGADSPDLISSASAPDDSNRRILLSAISAPPGFSDIPFSSAVQYSSIELPSVLSPTSSTHSNGTTNWPKAPDITMPLLQSESRLNTVKVFNPVVNESSSSYAMDSVVNQVKNFPTDTKTNESNVPGELSVIQQSQEQLLNDQKEKIDSISKLQKQFIKQCEAAWKRSQQQSERLEKAVKAITQSQLEFRNDIKVGRSSVTDSLLASIDDVVKTQVQRHVLPGVTGSLKETNDKLSTIVAHHLSTTELVFTEMIGNTVKSKDMIDSLSDEIATLLHERIKLSLPNIFLQTMIPAFERCCQVMFQQLASTYHKGIEEIVKQSEKQIQSRLKLEYDNVQQVSKEATDTIKQLQGASKQLRGEISNTINKQAKQNLEQLFKKFEDQAVSRMLQSISQQQKQQQNNLVCSVKEAVNSLLDEKLKNAYKDTFASQIATQTPSSSLLRQQSLASQQEKILKFLQRGDLNAAFQTALNAGNLTLVMHTCESVDPSMIFNTTSCPLAQPVLLSLIQQLSSELGTKTEIKLRYLQESLMNLDHSHKVTRDHLTNVLGTLIQNVSSVVENPLQPYAKQLKMLSMAAQSLKK